MIVISYQFAPKRILCITCYSLYICVYATEYAIRYGTVGYGRVRRYTVYNKYRSYGMYNIYGVYRSYPTVCTDRTVCTLCTVCTCVLMYVGT